MADERISTILAVELDATKVATDLEELSRQIANAKNEQKLLNEQLKAGEISETEYAKSTAAVKDELSWLQKQQKGVIATTKLLTAQTDTYSDSLNGQKQKLADMQKAYDQLTASQRESAAGQEFAKALKEQSDVVKELEEATGRAQRNVGNYPKVVTAIIPSFDKMTAILGSIGVSLQDLQKNGVKAFSNLGTSLKTFGKAFLTPPIAIITAVLGAIVLTVQKVSEAFKKNDDAMTALTKAFAIFEPIGDGVAKVFDWVAQGLAKVAEGAAKVVQWIAGKVAPAYAQAAKDAQELVQAQDNLQEAERKYTENSAKRNAQIAELKAKVLQTERYTNEERKQFLKDAIDLEEKNLQEAKANAAERVRILEETAKKESDTSDETKDKIAQAKAAMYQAEQAYFDGTRRLQKQLSDFEAEESQRRVDAWEQEWNNKRLIAEAALATEKAILEEFNEQARAALQSLDEDEEENVLTPEEQARRMFGLDEEGVQYFLDMISRGYDFAIAKSSAFQDQTARTASSVGKALGGVSNVMQAVSDSFERLGEESDDMKKASKAFAWVALLTGQAQAIANTVVAITKAIENAQQSAGATGPAAVFTAPAFIAEMVAITTGAAASAISGIATAIQLVRQADGYEHGGVVGGTSYTGDKILIRANSGEGIYTGKQANTLLQEIANNPLRGGMDAMTEALVTALEAMPAPVMVYQELRDFEQNVSTYDELSKI